MAAEPLPLARKVLYASSSLGSEALAQSRGLWLVYYYAPPEDADLRSLLSLGVIGGLLFAGRLLEAFDDALIGYWSDRTRSRLGRRLPFILGATPFWALFAFLLFTPPTGSGWTTGVYLFVVLELFFLFGTLSGGPYEALLPELARTNRDRLAIVGIRVYLGAAGAAVGLVGSGLIVDYAGFKVMALVMAAVALAFRYLGMTAVWKQARRSRTPAEMPFRDAVKATFSNAYFLLFLPTFVLFQIALQMLLGVLPFYVKAVLRPEKTGTWVAILTAVAIVTMVASVPFFGRLAVRQSKRQAYSLAMLGAALLFPFVALLGFLPWGPKEAQAVAAMVLVGVPIAGVYLFPAALTADIVDYDSIRTGMRREATYYGMQNFVEKTATSLAPLFLALLLLLGNTAGDPLGIRLSGPAAGLLALAGWIVFRRYDLPDEVGPEAAARTRMSG